jgi:hypothetical protein
LPIFAQNLAEEKDKKIKELQDNVAAVNFTPSSKHGKMLMAKCRTLQEENEEIGAMASEGKVSLPTDVGGLNMLPNCLCFSKNKIIGFSLNNNILEQKFSAMLVLPELVLTELSFVQIHELGMKIAVLKTQNNELRNQFDGTCQVTSK